MADRPTAVPSGLNDFLSSEAPPSGDSGVALPKGLGEFIAPEMNEEKYGSPLEVAKTFLEGAASDASFGLSKGVERAFGVKPEDMRLREETNPIAAGTGKAAGFIGSAFVPGGAAKVLGKAGKAVASAAGLTGLGGAAARLATEGALYQSSNELAKMFEQDPDQTMQTALSHIGLSAVIAPALGVPLEGAGKLWSASVGKKLAPYLQAVKDKAGVASTELAGPNSAALYSGVPEAVGTASEKAGSKVESLLEKGARHAASALLVGSGHHYLGALNELTGKFFTNAAEDAGKVAWSRFLNKAESNPEAFKAMLDAANAAAKGLKQINNAAMVAVAGAGAAGIEELSDKKVEKLEKAAEEYRIDPSKFMNIGNELSVYEPAHAAALAGSVARSMDYINENKPKTDPPGLLDPQRVPSVDEVAKYRRNLQIVDDPTAVLTHVANGTLTTSDLETLSKTNPGLHSLMSQKLMDHVITAKSKGQDIPYSTRMSMSLFLGQPLDASMTPEAIASNQLVHQRVSQAQQQEQGKSLKSLSKDSQQYLTPQQARVQSRQ